MLFVFLLLPLISMASEDHARPLGIVKQSSYAYRTMAACRGERGKFLYELMTLVVAGHYRCQPAYGEAKDYLVVYYGKQRFFVEDRYVFMTDEDRTRLPELDDQILAKLDLPCRRKKATCSSSWP